MKKNQISDNLAGTLWLDPEDMEIMIVIFELDRGPDRVFCAVISSIYGFDNCAFVTDDCRPPRGGSVDSNYERLA